MKRIVIISGVTGAIGSVLLSEYAQSNDNVIYGISRKALPIEKFLIGGKLPQNTLICSLKSATDFEELFSSMNYSNIDEIIYIHALGLYPFEVNKFGEVVVENDYDNDGVNDETTKLSLTSFTNALTSLTKYWNGKTKYAIFGGLADVHEPSVHQSWWKTMKKVKLFAKEFVLKNPTTSITVFNISSVLCPHEIITRPFVFIHTDADQTKWLHPYELAQFVVSKINETDVGFKEFDKYRIKPDFNSKNYYDDSEFTPRKVDEIF